MYKDWYAIFWKYIDEYLIDHENGSWFHQLNKDNEVIVTVWPGKPDLYHATQCTLIPSLDPSVSVAPAMKANPNAWRHAIIKLLLFSPPIREEPRSLHKATGVLRISNQITQRMQFTYFQPRLHHYLMIGRRGADTSTLCLSPITFGSLMILSTTAFFNLRSEESPHTITRSPPLISVVMES